MTDQLVGVQALVLRAPIEDPVEMSFGRMLDRQVLLVALSSSDGGQGVGEVWANWPAWAPEERLVLLARLAEQHLLGLPPDGWADATQSLAASLRPQYRQAGALGLMSQVLSGVDVALWDLAARRGDAVADLAGAEPVPVYGSGVGIDQLEDDLERCQLMGLGLVKLRVGFDERHDLERVVRTREVLGSDVDIAVDANQAWDLATAIERGRSLRARGVSWIEEPTDGDVLDDLEAFYDACGLPVATGENVYERDEFLRRAASRAVRIIQPDVTKMGGMTPALELCADLADHDVAVVPHMYGGPVGLATSLQLAARSNAVVGVEYDLRANPLAEFPIPKHGVLPVSPTNMGAVRSLDGTTGHEYRWGEQPAEPAVRVTYKAGDQQHSAGSNTQRQVNS